MIKSSSANKIRMTYLNGQKCKFEVSGIRHIGSAVLLLLGLGGRGRDLHRDKASGDWAARRTNPRRLFVPADTATPVAHPRLGTAFTGISADIFQNEFRPSLAHGRLAHSAPEQAQVLCHEKTPAAFRQTGVSGIPSARSRSPARR
jgi:hypothetical protein